MLRTAPYFTTAPAYGLVAQLFDSSLKSTLEQGNRVASAVAYLSNAIDTLAPGTANTAGFLSLLDSIASDPPIFTVYRLVGPDGATFNVVSPQAPLFNFVA
ncbi:MAG TPA: hypothetical protein VG125_02560 [Pirellulales bacterium]|jgi:hypothetical protein|nr:hypothetical protein [Pirellulales bacterium]